MESSKRDERKCLKKQRRARHKLLREMNVECSETATQFLAICNAGLIAGVQGDNLQRLIDATSIVCELIMPVGKSYSFVKCTTKDDAQIVYDTLHGKARLEGQNVALYFSFVSKVPDVCEQAQGIIMPPGLHVIENFISEEEEKFLLNSVSWSEEGGANSSELKHRKVKHFGFEFKYGVNNVNPDEPIESIPEEYKFLRELFNEHDCGQYCYDQLTINNYLPGQGIPPHIDTHSPFEDTILSVSLGSTVVMDFKRGEEKLEVALPPRSLLIMKGEARYAWSHGICPRHSDVTRTDSGATSCPRSTRTSLTFRKVRKGLCQCHFLDYCDSKESRLNCEINSSIAGNLEDLYVHEVYEEISGHFNETRLKEWPNVVKFLDSLDKGSLLLDVGCGNGKYLKDKSSVFKMGCDRSQGLLEICRSQSYEVLTANCLSLPYRDNTLDAVLSIAVIHHLSTCERRREAVQEMMRVLRPSGRCLIYVWAKEQNRESKKSTYLLFNSSSKPASSAKSANEFHQVFKDGLMLPVHENRTEFAHSDLLVPWKKKGGGDFLRFYHVFEENELHELCSSIPSVIVERVYYDQGNWCIILGKAQ